MFIKYCVQRDTKAQFVFLLTSVNCDVFNLGIKLEFNILCCRVEFQLNYSILLIYY